MKTIKIEIKETKIAYHTIEVVVDDNLNEKDIRDQIELDVIDSGVVEEAFDFVEDKFKVKDIYECEYEYCDHLEITDVYED